VAGLTFCPAAWLNVYRYPTPKLFYVTVTVLFYVTALIDILAT